MTNQSVWNLLISASAVIITLLGVMLARRGKRRDELQAEKAGSWGRMIGEAEYLSDQLVKERESFAQWRKRQVDRCASVIGTLTGALTEVRMHPDHPEDADAAISEAQQHLETDHG